MLCKKIYFMAGCTIFIFLGLAGMLRTKMTISGVSNCSYLGPIYSRILSNFIIWWRTQKIKPHWKNCVIQKILPIQPESFGSTTILFSLKESIPNNIVSFSIRCQVKGWKNKFLQRFWLDLKMPYFTWEHLWIALGLSCFLFKYGQLWFCKCVRDVTK